MKRGFLSQKGSGGGRGVKEKDLNRNKKNTASGIDVSTDSEDTMNDDTPIGVASAVREGLTPSVVDMTVEMGKQNSLQATIIQGSFPLLSMLVSSTAGNAPGKSSYANITSKLSGKKVNILTLFTPEGNGIDVVALVDSIRAISEHFANISYGFFSWGRRWHTLLLLTMLGTLGVNMVLFAQSFIEDGLSAITTKLGTPSMLDSYTSDMCMQSWGRSSYARVMIELRADIELKDNILMAMPKITRDGHYKCSGEKKTVKNPSQTSRGILVLTSVDNDEDLGTNGGIANSADKGTNNVSSSNNPIGEKIKKIKRQICEDNDDYDPYDGNMYENHDLSEHLQSICNDLDITVRGRKKKYIF
nr:hypothetical protein [Tanacetum cinerariifolium]